MTTPTHLPRTLHAQDVVATTDNYLDAQAAVDTLSDRGFDVSTVQIVGHGIQSVEYVHGRMTKGRATGYGALSGLWFGLVIGLLIGLFLPGVAWLSLMLTALVLGAVWGAVFGFFGHLATGGKRDFTSTQGLRAQRYDVLVDATHAVEARRLLGLDVAPESVPAAH